MPATADTIAAISSAVGAAPRMIVRLSGGHAHAIAGNLIAGDFPPDPGGASLRRLHSGVAAWVYIFANPRSYTGEDLVEFHLPGSPVLARMLLDEIIQRGARPAEPGEFTARAYFNGRIDLTQAEGVAATIGAQSERELRAARQLLAGELARRLQPVMDDVAQALALVEVGIDFSDEDVTFIAAADLRDRCAAAATALQQLLDQSARFERLSHEPRVVLVGRPNAGKSTLLNALAGLHRAVVSDVAGTTRDAIWADVKLARGMIRLVDVAGIAEAAPAAAGDSAQASIARQMHEQAIREFAMADLVVLVEGLPIRGVAIRLERRPDLVVRSKSDLRSNSDLAAATANRDSVAVSAKTGAGLDVLRATLDRLAFGTEATTSGLALNARHVRALAEARDALRRAAESTAAGAEVAALELREALDALGGVLGRISPDELLGRIFSQFCMGK